MISLFRAGRAGEGDRVDSGVLDEIRAEGAVGRDDVDRTGGEADLGRELGEPQHAQRRLRIRLEDDGAAGVAEQRAADGIGAAGDRADHGGEEAKVLGT